MAAQFHAVVLKEMKEQGTSASEVARRSGLFPAVVEKVIEGALIPSNRIATAICTALGMKVKPNLDLIAQQRRRFRERQKERNPTPTFGQLMAKHPRLRRFYAIWDELPERRRRDLLLIAASFLHQRRTNDNQG